MTDRNVTFYFEGQPLRGLEGEPIAKALFTAGIRTLSYSVKYKRPRGVHCARGRCVACHMSVDGVPGVPTCITPLRAGMTIEREDYRPLYGPLATLAARLFPLPAGFYYRMFTKPAFIRRFFLKNLRRMAGVGRLEVKGPPGRTAGAGRLETHGPPGSSKTASDRVAPLPVEGSYDVVVVGSGLSGMSAALSSAHHGSEVLLVDEYGFPGGHSFGYQPDTEMGSAREELVERINQHTSIHYRPNITALGFYPPDVLLLGPGGVTGFRNAADAFHFAPGGPTGLGNAPDTSGTLDESVSSVRRGMKRVRGRAFVFATGANDVVPLFENSDTPGIFGARAIRLLLERHDWRPGRRAVVYGTGTPLRVTAQLLLHHDIKLVALVDPLEETKTDQRRRVLDNIRRIPNARITAAKGGQWLKAVEITRGAGAERSALACDLLCVALPGQPAFELAYQAGFEYALSDSTLEEFRVMAPLTPRLGSEDGRVSYFVAGQASGETDWRKKIESGNQAGAQAAASVRG